MQRIGLLGGTFDPVHLGHLILAETARDLLQLDRVDFIPAADPPHKQNRTITPASHRVAMLDMALADNPSFHISRVDLDRPGPHFTADMLGLVREQLAEDDELWFLMGLDSLIDFLTWREPDRIRQLARLAAATRPGYEVNWQSLEAALPGLHDNVTVLPMPGVSIASHELRQRVAEGLSIRYFVPSGVRDYILAQQLYVRNE